MPQCADIGWPGHTGHASAAAWSQTVNTKSIRGLPGFENSDQSLLRSPSVGRRFFRINSSASGCTRPFGWLPALKALKRPLPMALSRTSAMMLRAELPVQRNRTLKVFGFMRSLGIADEPAHTRGDDRLQAAFRRIVVQVIDFIGPALWRRIPVRALWHVDGSSCDGVCQ